MKISGFCMKAVLCMAVTALALSSCRDTDYDLDNIDATVGVGSQTLSLPGNNNTQDITLDDVFDLTYTKFVHIDDDGYYYVAVDDHATHDTSVLLARIIAEDDTKYESSFTFNRNDLEFGGMRAPKARKEIAAHFTGVIGEYDLHLHNMPESLAQLDYVSTTSTIKTSVSFSENFQVGVNNIAKVKLYFPSFMDVEYVSFGGERFYLDEENTTTIYNVSPKSPANLIIHVQGLDFTAPSDGDSQLIYVRGDEIHAHGIVKATGTVNQSDVDLNKLHASDVYTCSGTCVIGKVVLNRARGYFNPKFDVDRLGRVVIGALPPFLSDDDVQLDLSDLKVDLSVSNDLPTATLIQGKLVGKNQGGAIVSRVQIPQFALPADTSCVVSLRSHQEGKAAGDTMVVVVPNLPDVLCNLPDSILFTDLTVEGDPSQLVEVTFGKRFHVTTQFSLSAPMAFGPSGRIVWQHPYLNWNHVLKDVSFMTAKDGTVQGHIEVTTDVENKLPIYLDMGAYGIDVNGDSISTNRLVVEVEQQVKASPDGTTVVTTPQTLYLRALDNSVFKELDGIMLKVAGSASDENGQNSITGQRLNYEKHTVRLSNIQVKLVGKLAVDLN